MKKPFCAYTFTNRVLSPKRGDSFWDFAVFLNVPLSHFKRTRGCVRGSAMCVLGPNSIGAYFNIKILDPVHLGVGKLLGYDFNAIPNSNFKEALKEYEKEINTSVIAVFLVKKQQKEIIVVVKQNHCDVTPIKKRRSK